MKIKNLTKRALAFALVCITIAGSTPAVDVHAEDTSSSKVDIYATQSSDYLITIPKQLILDGKSGTGAYRVSVKGNISGTDIITVTPDERFFMKQEGKTDILTTIEQIKTQFTYADGVRPEVEVTADGKVQMEKISAGKWTGLFNFNITSSVDLESEDSVGSTIDDIKGNGTGKDTAQNKYSEYITTGAIVNIPVSARNEKGEDINATSSNIVGSKAEDLLDSLKETGHIEDTEEVDALIEVKSDDFDGLAETTFDVSNIAQPGDEVIILHYDETKQMWEFIGHETVTEEGTVTGDFTSYSPVAFVKVDKKGEIKPHFHNYRTSIKDATCVLDGLMTYICDECDHKTDVTIDKLGHNHISSIVPPTCTENGYTLYVCSRCNNEYKDDTVNATGHTVVKVGTSEIHEKCSTCGVTLSDKHELTNEVLINPTCTEKGTTKYSCECGYTFNEQDINALGHTPVNGGTVSIHSKCSVCNATLETEHTYTKSTVSNAGCTTAGLIKYTCDCGYSYTEEVAILGHSYGDYVTTTEATCTADGVKTKTCTVCGNKETAVITKLGHNYSTTYTVDKEATCTTAGSKSQHCSRCSSTQNVTSIPATGHTTVNAGTKEVHTKCSVCGTTLSTSHIYTEEITPSTCLVNGIKTFTCTCGYSYSNTLTAPGHNIVCRGTSDIHTQCSRCGEVLSTTHTYTKTTQTASTCTVKGTSKYTCSCGYYYTDQDIAVLGHNYGTPSYTWTGYTACKASRTCTRCNNVETENGTITNAVTTTATCTATGVRTYTAKFSNTAFATQTKTESIAKLSHTSVNGGTSSVHTKCSVCGTTLTTSHSYTVDSGVQYKAATCTTKRQNYKSCSCGYNPKSASYVVETGSVNSSNHTGTVVNGGTSGVHTKYNCCGATVSATHSYTVDSGVQYKAATCTTKRQNYKSCSCGYNPKSASYVVETGSINSSNHTGSVVNGGTSGVHTKYSCCGATVSSTHSYTVDSGVQYTAATCTAKRQNYKSCSCGYNPKSASYVVETGSINSSNHTGSIVNGGTSGVHTKYSCCGATVSSTHSYTVDSGVQYTAATCTSARYNYKKCSCGYNPKSASYVVATGSKNSSNHTGSVVNGGTSGVHTKYNCCGATVSATHSYTNKVTTAATCTTAGVRTYTCGCGYSYTASITAIGHSYSSYSTNSTQHWKACTNNCGTKTSVGNHADGGTDGLCDTCGYKGTIVYTYHTHSDSVCYTWSQAKSCKVCGGDGKVACTSCNGLGAIIISATCGGKIVQTGTTTDSYTCSTCGTGGAGGATYACTLCNKQYSVGGYGCNCGSSSYGYLPEYLICGATAKDCTSCSSGNMTCSFCKGSNNNLVSKNCSTCSGVGNFGACGGTLKQVSSSSGSFSCGTCGGGGYGSTTVECQTCGVQYTAGGSGCGCGSSSFGYIPSSCTSKEDCSYCNNGKLYRVNYCGKTTSTVESQYTKFQ